MSSALAGGKDSHSEHWGIINRNTIGSPVGALRDGPAVTNWSTGQISAPPFGKGSLEIEVANSQEKVSFGNEVDFFGDPVSGLNQLGYYVFQTGEDVGYGGKSNLPNITFEINPDITNSQTNKAIGYTSMVWDPNGTNVPADEWSPYIDATDPTYGNWYFTGSAGSATTGTGCNISSPCTFDVAKGKLGPNASILTVAIAKGRDNQFQGAVDGLRINDKTYDFEADGVKAKGAGK